MKRVTFLFLLVVLILSVSSVVARNAMNNAALSSRPANNVTSPDPNGQPPPIIIPPVDIPPDSCSHHHVDGCTHDGDQHDNDRHDDQDDQGENESSADED